MNEPLPSDDELMEQAREGDTAAFAALYERHRARTFTFLARLTGSRDVAEELLQEVFLRVWRGRAAYRASGRFCPWLYTVARRLAIDHVRSRAPRAEPVPEDAVPAELPAAAARAEARQELARVAAALAALPPAQREVLLLSRVAGLDAGEIADVVDSTPGAVRVALHRALARLRDYLAGH